MCILHWRRTTVHSFLPLPLHSPEANPIRNSIHYCYGCQTMGVRFLSRGSPIAAAVLSIAALFRQTFYQVVLTKNVFYVKSFQLYLRLCSSICFHPLVQSKISTIEIKMCRLILGSQLSSILYNIALVSRYNDPSSYCKKHL
uniref:Uncharacterized protein n=1 Tax=Ixodes ricinus TaxID=34613 RepID=A0A6B0UTW0_IXORI